MFTSILCPVDFSEHSERALAYALDLAALAGGHVTILTVVDALLDAATLAAGRHQSLETQTREEIKAFQARVAARRGVEHTPTDVTVAVGHAAEEILRHAVECHADLIVMGTQGLQGARRLVFGSTTARVLRESPVPVLAVPIPRAADA